MSQKKLVGELVDHYYKLEAVKTELELNAGVDSEQVALLTNLLIDIDKLLTNISKRWAKGNREPKAVQDTLNTL